MGREDRVVENEIGENCMSYELTGKVKIVQDAQTFGSGFTKRELVVIVEAGKYPQEICLECVQDKVSLLDGVRAGDEVVATFDIRGKEYGGRYFNNLQCWKLEVKSARGDSSSSSSSSAPDNGIPEPADEDDDDIPF